MTGFGAGYRPGRVAELLASLPFRQGPDVLGVRRNAPVEAGRQRGITGDRCRRMQEMSVKAIDIGGQFGRQYQRLAKAAYPVRGRVAP